MEIQSANHAWRLIWHLAGIVLVLVAGSLAAWGTPWFWLHEGGRVMVALVAAAFVVGAVTFEILGRYPETHQGRLILIVYALLFLGVIFVIAFLRLYYSRSFLLTSFLVTVGWAFVGYWLLGGVRQLRLGLVTGGIADQLREMEGPRWVILDEPAVDPTLDGVVVDWHERFSDAWIQFLANCSLRRIPIHHAASVFETLTGRVSLDHLSEGLIDDFHVPLVYDRVLKRVMDITVVVLSSVIVLPVCLLAAVAIKLESPGPVLFRQERMGQGDRPFTVLKFRSMRADAESGGARFAEKRDRRLTVNGRIIRKFRIDELPQFWNVLKGEMSLIGPRPEQVPFVKRFEQEIPFYAYRHMIKPGISGWAQVSHGYASDVEATQKKLEYDLYYAKHMSFWLDLLIIFKTLKAIFTNYGAR